MAPSKSYQAARTSGQIAQTMQMNGRKELYRCVLKIVRHNQIIKKKCLILKPSKQVLYTKHKVQHKEQSLQMMHFFFCFENEETCRK